jgi:carboxyl-terminal processing protease
MHCKVPPPSGLLMVAAALTVAFGVSDRAAIAARVHRNGSRPAATSGRRASYASDFDTIWKLVRDRFYDPKLNGVDWARIGETYRAKLADVRSKREFQALVNEMIRELHASHAGYYTDDDVEFYMLPAVLHQDLSGYRTEHIGVMGSAEVDEYVVAGVLEGGPADKAGIRSGDRLLAVDGAPFRSAGSFRGKDGTPVSLEYKRATDGAIHTASVVPVRQNILRAFLAAMEKSARILPVGSLRLGYVHLWTMGNDAFRAALNRIVEGPLHDTDGLILDLRDGYGGSPWTYADVFYRPDVTWQQAARGGPAVTLHSGYGKPMGALVNGGTRSAKEFFSYELKSTQRATLVGTRTAGAFLGAGGFEVGSVGLLEIPVLGLKVDGRVIEGIGVSPDITVPPDQTYSDRDSQLFAAERELQRVIAHGKDAETAHARTGK